MSLKQQASDGTEINESMSALINNANAIRAISLAVEGTLGPKGLDTMLVDQFGEVVITNDGVTILTLMEANHPVAKMLINIAKAQQEEIGDGTTTATIMAGALVGAGVEQVARGVPVARVIEGLKVGIKEGIKAILDQSLPITDLNMPLLKQVALVAGREHEDIADLVIKAGLLIGEEMLKERNFKLSDTVIAQEGAENQVFMGVVIDKEMVNRQMPSKLEEASVLIIDDALEPEEIEAEALSTETGFKRYLELQNQHKLGLEKIIDLGIKVVLVDRGIDDVAEEMLTDAGIMVVQRVSFKELRKVCDHIGAKMIKRRSLKKDKEELKNYLGLAKEVYNDEKLKQVWILGGKGKPMATLLVGASTAEVVGERERIAKDASSAVQAAVKGGVVSGGGSAELFAIKAVEKARQKTKGMAAYGLDCVLEALKRPMAQIVANAGFNPLEKLGDVISSQKEGQNSLAVDCETGKVCDMYELGVVDPVLVKTHALKAAGEVAEAILRIDTIIKKKEGKE